MDGVGGLHHQPFPPARGRPPEKGAGANGGLEGSAGSAADRALGRSRGGLSTKVHLACDGRCLPLAVVLTPGNVNDCTVFKAVLESVRVPRAGAGRPRQRPDTVIADKAYSSREVRQDLRRRGIRAVIPVRTDQRANRQRRGRAGGRPPAFDPELCKARNVVERCFSRLKQFRAIASASTSWQPATGPDSHRLTHPLAPPTRSRTIARHGLELFVWPPLGLRRAVRRSARRTRPRPRTLTRSRRCGRPCGALLGERGGLA
ncbi:DDE family transposase [Streptomyces puniciscabiei]|uniref:DDE family transposase n=1 Tax=Streptomyces puniciscabiei TaxID=164348 RepID=A0A542UNX3_9ACTN|nr:DDE family transposase [Streptomyces puniciscabiei]